MNRFFGFLGAAALGAVLVALDAEAARLGGGRSVGTQRSVTSAPSSAPARQAQPAQQQQPQQQAPAASGSKWGPILGGLAIGALLGSMFGGGLGWIVLLAVIAFFAMFLVRTFARQQAQTQPAQFAGLGQTGIPMPAANGGFSIPAAARVPAGFDTEGFLRGAKRNFLKLQLANDAGRLDEIRELTTQELFGALQADAGRGHTDVVSLEAELLEVVTEGDRHWASVRFSGALREAPGAAPAGFSEIWNLAKPVDGSSGWLLAGIQQTH